MDRHDGPFDRLTGIQTPDAGLRYWSWDYPAHESQGWLNSPDPAESRAYNDRMEPICQSCGMPMRMDSAGGGTHADGSQSNEYCSHCYRAGTWVLPQLSVDEMQRRVGGLLKGKAPDDFVAKAVGAIPALKRWRK